MKVEIELNIKLVKKLKGVFPTMRDLWALRDITLAAIEKQEREK